MAVLKPVLVKFLTTFWGLAAEDLKEDLVENDHYIAWYCGIDHIVNRDLTPDAVVILKDFKTYTFNPIKTKKETVINYKDGVDFFYNTIRKFIEIYYEGKPFEMRIIQIPDGYHYLEFKLDDKYSFVYQMIYVFTEEEIKELKEYHMTKEMPDKVDFNTVFKKITMGDDMIL